MGHRQERVEAAIVDMRERSDRELNGRLAQQAMPSAA